MHIGELVEYLKKDQSKIKNQSFSKTSNVSNTSKGSLINKDNIN